MSILNNLPPSLSRAPATANGGTTAGQPRAVRPAYEIQETPDAFALSVHLPGVAKDGLDLTADGGEVRIVGRRAWQQPEGWSPLYRESVAVPFELVLAHDNAIDAGRIAAEIRDGLLHVSLPKAEAVKPRKIAVN